MAPQSAPCKEWIIIITHNLLFNTCLLLQFFKKLHTTVIHKSTSSCFFCCFFWHREIVSRVIWKTSAISILQLPLFSNLQSHPVFAYSHTRSVALFWEAGIVDTSLQLFPVSSEKPPTPLECLVCALWSLILIIKLSLQHEPWAANSGALGSSALNQSNQVLHWRTFFSFFNQVILILPYLIFIIMLVPFSNGVKISLPPEALHGQVWIFKPRRNLEHPTFASELCDNNCFFYFPEQAKLQRVLQSIRCVPPQCLLMEPC